MHIYLVNTASLTTEHTILINSAISTFHLMKHRMGIFYANMYVSRFSKHCYCYPCYCCRYHYYCYCYCGVVWCWEFSLHNELPYYRVPTFEASNDPFYAINAALNASSAVSAYQKFINPLFSQMHLKDVDWLKHLTINILHQIWFMSFHSTYIHQNISNMF